MENRYMEIYEKLSKLQWLLQRQHILNHAEHGPFADTSRGQGRVLAMLKIQPEISTKDLSYLLGIKVASLNELLNKLEKGGFIVRKPSEADKRVMIIHLTEKGKSEEQAPTDYSGIFNCLSEEEQDNFADYLDRVIEALEDQLGDYGDMAELENWRQAARSRMGNEQFNRLAAMRGGFDRHDHGRDRDRGRREDFPGGFDPQGRGRERTRSHNHDHNHFPFHPHDMGPGGPPPAPPAPNNSHKN